MNLVQQKTLVFLDQNMEQGCVYDLPEGQAGVFSRKSHLKEGPNEDAAAIIPVDTETIILAVADGAGGLRAGEQASRMAIEEIVASVENGAAADEGLRELIFRAFERANEAILKHGVGAATTLAVALVEGRAVRFFHAGDSMIVLTGQRGHVRFQTTMHSPVGYALESGLIGEKEAMHHDERHLVSNVLGSGDMSIEMGPAIDMRARDTLLLATDGLFDNLHVEEAVERCRKGPLEKVLKHLSEDCLQRMISPAEGQPSKADDLTLIAFRPPRKAKN
jgi:serine/threonine protein phosphatase PrpC